MNRYQVIMPNGDVLAVKASGVSVSAGSLTMLTFYENAENEANAATPVAQFCTWAGWNLLGPVEPQAGNTP